MKSILFILFIAAFNAAVSQENFKISTNPTDSLTSVLFVGNSYTYFWNLPQNVSLMAESQNFNISCKQSTAGGANLGQHWRGEKDLESRKLISNYGFDVVVLQDHSLSAIEHPDSLLYFGKLFGELIKKSGATPYVYMTWSRKWDPFTQEIIKKEYIKLAQSINARIVPVGLAWEKARQLRPEICLYDSDGSHPSALGAYLSACVFYAVLTNQSPVGLPYRLESKDMFGEKLYINLQSENDALFCQKVAHQIVQEFPD